VDWIKLTQNRDLVAGSSEYNNEPFDSIKEVLFFDQLSDYSLLKDFGAWSYIMVK
jgi:hypothetical protein